jgi:hypothetical protein
MTLYDHLLATRTKEDLARMLAQEAKANAALKDRISELKVELFWLLAKERDDFKLVAWRYKPSDGLSWFAYTEREPQALGYDPNPTPLYERTT